ncbi:hypothetical protein VUN82_08460 [Micrococcaceae bacterium Sec5.1]
MLRHPACALLFEGLDLVPGGAVKFLARDILIDLRRTFAVRAVGAANVLRVGNAGGTVFPGVGAVIVERTTLATTLGTVTKRLTLATIIAERTTLLAITTRAIKVPRATLRAATEGLTLATVTVERTTLTTTRGTVTKRLTLATVAVERTTLTIARGTVTTVIVEGTTLIAISTRAIEVPWATLGTVTEGFTLAAVVVERTTLTITGRTITAVIVEGTTLIAISTRAIEVPWATLGTVTEGFTLGAVVVERTTLTITGRTITAVTAVTERLTITIATEGTTLTIAGRAVAERLTLATVIVERTTLTITGRTITAVTTVTKGLTITIATEGTTLLTTVAILPGTESARVSTGVVVGAERAALTAIPAKVSAVAVAIAAVVLSHGGFLLLRADHWRVRSRS